MLIRRWGPGLVRTVARTAVVAGTATAVSRGVSGMMTSSAQAKQQEQMAEASGVQAEADVQELQAQMQAMQAQQAQQALAAQQQAAPSPVAAAAAAAPNPDMVAQLQQLAELKNAGMLSDEEFLAAKTKLLGG